jgi:hypothetical protein
MRGNHTEIRCEGSSPPAGVRHPLIGVGLCRILDMDFREFTFHDVCE